MASIVTYGDGLRRIDFAFAPNEPRRTVRLGRVSRKVAEAWQAKIEALIADKLARKAHEPEVATWLAELDEKMLARLRAAGLAEGVGLADTTLGAFLGRAFDAMTVKSSSRIVYGNTRRCLQEFLGTNRTLRSVKPEDADGWRAWLATHEALSSTTIARRVKTARMLFRKAARWKLIGENPFEGIKAGNPSNEARKVFVPRELIERAIAEAPDAEWRAIIALARFGGLRTPSEHFGMKWGDIDWDRGTIRVCVPKLEHIDGKGERVVPLFPELRAPLLELFGQAEPGSEFVIARHRLGCANLRTQFQRILRRAGITPWPRLFHNLRASRETELMREYDLATVCKWIGNSPEMAAKHYASSVDLNADFRRASALSDNAQQKAQQKAQQSAAERACPAMTAKPGDDEESLEKKGNVDCGQLVTTPSKTPDWSQRDSNSRPSACHADALPTAPWPRRC